MVLSRSRFAYLDSTGNYACLVLFAGSGAKAAELSDIRSCQFSGGHGCLARAWWEEFGRCAGLCIHPFIIQPTMWHTVLSADEGVVEGAVFVELLTDSQIEKVRIKGLSINQSSRFHTCVRAFIDDRRRRSGLVRFRPPSRSWTAFCPFGSS